MSALTDGLRRQRWARPGRAGGALVVASVAVLAITAANWSLALFTGQYQAAGDLSAALIFRGERGTVPFSVSDQSSGTAADGSSALAFDGDGRWFVSRAWPTTFSGTRYLELELNDPLPAALTASGVSLAIHVAADGAGQTVCYYAELRRVSNGALLSSHGSGGSPLDCVTGTGFESIGVTLGAVSSTDIANDLRLRLYATSSAATSLRIDRLTVGGASPYAGFTLYPVLTRDVDGGDIELIPWGLADQ